MFYKNNIFYAFCYFLIFTPIKPPTTVKIKTKIILIIEGKLNVIFSQRLYVKIIFKIIISKNEIIEHIYGLML